MCVCVMQAMSDLSRQQSEVKQLAQSSLETLLETQQEAEVREREIAARQEGVKEKIATNLEHLAREKILISSGQQLLANMTSDIKAQLGQSIYPPTLRSISVGVDGFVSVCVLVGGKRERGRIVCV